MPPSRAWRAFVALAALAASGSLLAWVGLDDVRRGSPLWWCAAFAGIAICLVMAASLWPRGTSRLAFDGVAWQWRPAARGAGEAQTVRPQVAVDLGFWVLLRLRSVDARRSRWLALERTSTGPIWHAMRCALHDAPHDTSGPAGPVSTRGLSS